MNIIDRILNFKNRERSKIEDKTPSPCLRSSAECIESAKDFAEKLMSELHFVSEVNSLLISPQVNFDRAKHVSLETAPIKWLDNGSLVILFSIETNKPVCARIKKGASEQ